MELPRADQAKLSDDGLACYHTLLNRLAKCQERCAALERHGVTLTRETTTRILSAEELADLIVGIGRMRPAPEVTVRVNHDGARVRLDAPAEPELWAEVWLPAMTLAQLLRATLHARPVVDAPLVALLDAIV